MVLIEYRVPLANAAGFARAMEGVGHVRKRDGAWRWHLFQDTADAEHWYEAFTSRAGCTICASVAAAPRPTRSSSSAPADFSTPGSSRSSAG